MDVFVTTYEVNAAGLPLIEQHNARLEDWRDRACLLAERYGATGCQPAGGGIWALVFNDQVPPDWREVAHDRKTGKRKAVPRKNSNAGRAIATELANFGRIPSGEDAAALFDWNPSELAVQDCTVFYPVAQTVALPSPRHFVRLPRFGTDGWPGHAGLTEIPESEYMRALEAHNTAVARLRAGEVPA